MSFTRFDPEHSFSTKTASPIEEIKRMVNELHDILASKEEAATNPSRQTTFRSKPDGDVVQQVLGEVGQLCKQLQRVIRLLENFDISLNNELTDLLHIIGAKVRDILTDLPEIKNGGSTKRVQLNLRVLVNKITLVKIYSSLQHKTVNRYFADQMPLQTTDADQPHLGDKGISSRSLEEIKEKYEALETREKRCLFCFSIFPENAEIKKRLLRFWWVGENLVLTQNPEEEKKLVNETLEKFVSEGFIQHVQKKNKLQPSNYKMSPMVRSCVIEFAKEERFFDYDEEGNPTMNFSSCKKACMVKSQGIPEGSWFYYYLKGPREADLGRLSADLLMQQKVFNFPDKGTLEETSRRFDKLETLFNISRQFPALPKEWFSKMTGINVLYLGRWESSAGRQRHIEVEDTDVLEGFKNMKKLRLLCLQGIFGITKLPSSLCKLENLRILDLRACHHLEKLPERIGLLKNLTYLDLSRCYLLDEMPKQLSKLSELQVLKGFVISGGKNSCTLDDLSELGSLRKLSVYINTPGFDIDVAGEAISNFKILEKLKVAWRSGGVTKGNDSKKEKDAAKSKTKNHVRSAAKSSTENEANEKSQRVGSATMALTKGNNSKKEEDAAKLKTKKHVRNAAKSSTESRWVGPATTALLFINRLRRGKKLKDLHGLNKLVKLDFQCFPRSAPPNWLVPKNMNSLTNLCIKGGKLGYLHSDVKQWKLETLHLEYLMDFEMNWDEMMECFQELKYLAKVECPRMTSCPCDADGVWQKSSNTV